MSKKSNTPSSEENKKPVADIPPVKDSNAPDPASLTKQEDQQGKPDPIADALAQGVLEEQGPPIFNIIFAMDVLAEDVDEGVFSIQKALDDRFAPEGTQFPDILIGERFHKAVLERYIAGVRSLEVPLEETELVIADPETDPILKSLNFSRYLQGQPATWFYLRYL